MRPPRTLPTTLVALGEAFARRARILPDDFWDYMYRRKVPPPDLRSALVETFAPLVRESDFLLPSPANDDTLDTMNATAIAPARIGRPTLNPTHPFVVALRREGLTIREVAKKVGRHENTVKAWYKAADDEAFRPIPRDIAKRLKDLYKVPLSAWARIAD